MPKRGGSTSVTDRIVNQFLCYLDGVEGRSGVFVMAATSRPDLVDVALLRPGRIDKAVFCNFPSEDERLQILKIYLKKYNFEGEPEDRFLREIASRTESFTSADLRGLCQNSQLANIAENIQGDKTSFGLSEQDIYD